MAREAVTSYFVTGTDTEIGKTVVTAALAKCMRRHNLNVGVMKPVASGAVMLDGRLQSPDAAFLMDAVACEDDYDWVNPILFEPGLAPMTATILTGEKVALQAILDAMERLIERHDILLVEGIGGLLVPIASGWNVADLATQIDFPLLVVARPGLGTLNHTAMTVECARKRNLTVSGVVINHQNDTKPGLIEETNLDVIEELTGVPIVANIPYIPDLTAGTLPDNLFDEFLTGEFQ